MQTNSRGYRSYQSIEQAERIIDTKQAAAK